MNNGIFIISLDFELHWGGFEKWPLSGGRDYRQYFLNTRAVIPRMLELFSQHDVHATWATVGMLFHAMREELLRNAPEQKPGYHSQELSAYHYIQSRGIGENERDDPFHFAPSLIQLIAATSHQEIGTHTFAHYYCNEPGQTIEQFRDDIRAARRAAEGFGGQLRSLVFPRNQFNDRYLRACHEEGIRAVRSNPLDWFWQIDSTQSEGIWKRLNRGLDAYFPVGKKNTYSLDSVSVRESFPVCLPASRLLRPYRPGELFLNDLKIKRICDEMTRASRNSEVYHLWWHPHNFGWYPEQSLAGLEKILLHYRKCHDRYGMQSLNMGEVAGLLKSRKPTD